MKIIKTAKYVKAQKSRWTNSPGELIVNFDVGEMEEIYDISMTKIYQEKCLLQYLVF